MKKIPSVVQLPGGVKLQGIPFKIVERDDEGRPVKFEIQPNGTVVKGSDMCALFADESWIRRASK